MSVYGKLLPLYLYSNQTNAHTQHSNNAALNGFNLLSTSTSTESHIHQDQVTKLLFKSQSGKISAQEIY